MATKASFLYGKKILEYLSQNPAVGITISYLGISGAGLLHEVVFFRNFGIDIIDYFETTDFFLASFKRPLLFLLPFYILILFLIIYETLLIIEYNIEKLFHKTENKRKLTISIYNLAKDTAKKTYSSIIILIIFTLVYFPITFFANFNASRILTSKPNNVIFYLEKGEKKKLNINPIGSTTKFIFGISENWDYKTKLKPNFEQDSWFIFKMNSPTESRHPSSTIHTLGIPISNIIITQYNEQLRIQDSQDLSRSP